MGLFDSVKDFVTGETSVSSKGVDFFTYISDGFSIEVNKSDAKSDTKKYHYNPSKYWEKDHYEINSTHAGLAWEGHFQVSMHILVILMKQISGI